MMQKTLGHIKVLELCSLVSGPYCTKLLADLGAEVIKIEHPDAGDSSRHLSPFLNDIPHPEQSGLFMYLNTNKLGITLDITTMHGRKIFLDLVKQVDVFVEDKPPCFMEGLGVQYDRLKEINPRLVMTSITPFGQTGPYRDYKAYQLNSFHAGGEGYMLPIESTFPQREPLQGGGLCGDCNCGLSAALATLAAVYNVNRTGQGQHIDVSKQEVLTTLVGLEVAMYTYTGVIRNRHPRPALMALPIQCEDGHIMISAFVDRDWRTFSEFMGNTYWLEDAKFADMTSRWQNAEEVNEEVEKWAVHHKKDDLFHYLQNNSVSCSPVNNSEDIVRSAQISNRNFFIEIDHPRTGKRKYPGVPYKLSDTPVNSGNAAPTFGQHNQLIYCEQLGYDPEDLVLFKQNGVI